MRGKIGKIQKKRSSMITLDEGYRKITLDINPVARLRLCHACWSIIRAITVVIEPVIVVVAERILIKTLLVRIVGPFHGLRDRRRVYIVSRRPFYIRLIGIKMP